MVPEEVVVLWLAFLLPPQVQAPSLVATLWEAIRLRNGEEGLLTSLLLREVNDLRIISAGPDTYVVADDRCFTSDGNPAPIGTSLSIHETTITPAAATLLRDLLKEN